MEGWIDVLNDGVHPEPAMRRNPEPADGCPNFGDDSVLERAGGGAAQSVAPGVHAPRSGSHEVVWWDPGVLRLEVEQEVGVRQQSILEADKGGFAADAGVAAHSRWQQARRRVLAAGSVPSLQVAPVTALAAEGEAAPAPGAAVRLEEVALDRAGRPGGKRFGTLVHAALAVVDLDADAAAIERVVRSQARMIGSSAAECAAASTAVGAALRHPLLRRAANSRPAGGLRREAPVLARHANGMLAEGIVDLAFREPAVGEDGPRWTVVDFKTDRELGARRPEYEAQVRLYAAAISAATGEPADPVLLVV
jgi:ATP-dependent exoDNAse (exonuclease V) beta subunit